MRKSVRGQKFDRYFSSVQAGSMEQALIAATAYRDQLVAQHVGAVSYQRGNISTTTGYVGVAMHCRGNPARPGEVVHQFRAQAPDAGGRTRSRSWSIPRYGLLGAYTQAVRWRLTATGEPAPLDVEIEAAFSEKFLPLYMKFARDEAEPDERAAFFSSLEGLYRTTPTEAIREKLRVGRVCG
ncbi:MAG: hypothetical protein KAI85_03530 [Halopseudomonas aestusnigri]|nr:hypothetical protein [Halopseudomonas aestusnigri]